MSGNYFQGAPVTINSSNVLAGMQDVDYKPNIAKIMPQSDGRSVRTLITEGMVLPAVDMTTLNAGALLALLSSSGELPYLTLTDFKAFARKVDATGPVFASGTSHEQMAATAGVLFFTGLDCAANKEAVMSATAAFSNSSGDTHPVAFTQVAAPSDPLTIAPFTLDTVVIDGTTVDEVGSVSVKANVVLQSECGMKPYPRLVRPRFVDWSIDCAHNNMVLQRSKTDKAGIITVTYKSLNTGGPTRGSGVISFSVTGLLSAGGSTNKADGNSTVRTRVDGRHDGTNMPATWSYTP